ncbi:MAG: hypothetical protein HGA46_08440 [Chlorobiaceae bacterium]|nr:hypothetical protein [Chlorobiaceae bacterium]
MDHNHKADVFHKFRGEESQVVAGIDSWFNLRELPLGKMQNDFGILFRHRSFRFPVNNEREALLRTDREAASSLKKRHGSRSNRKSGSGRAGRSRSMPFNSRSYATKPPDKLPGWLV